MQTVKHEIAHALAGPGTHHGPIWKRVAMQIGCPPVRCYGSDVLQPEKDWIGTCNNCNHKIRRHRRKDIACSACCKKYNGGKYSIVYKFVWTPAKNEENKGNIV